MVVTAVIVCSAAAVSFLRSSFSLDRKPNPKYHCDEDIWCKEHKSNIVPLQIGPTAIEFWSQITWDRFLSATCTSEIVARRSDDERDNESIAA